MNVFIGIYQKELCDFAFIYYQYLSFRYINKNNILTL